MENFFIEDAFYNDFDDLIDSLLFNHFDSINDIPDDFKLKANKSEKRKVFDNLTHDMIMEFIEDTYIDELPEGYFDFHNEKVMEGFKKSFDIEAFRKILPSYYYATDEEFIITKQDLLDYNEKGRI